MQCPEGHYLHAPNTFFKPLVLNDELIPAQEGERGRFALIDVLAGSCPSFITTGNRGRMLEHCPVCDRPGPVLEPAIHRAKEQETQGCAHEVMRILGQDLSGG